MAVPKRYIRHKSHVPKTQFLCAPGRPREGFDGKVGCWRVTKSRPALRNKHVGPNAGRKVGDAIIEDATLDAAKYVEMMTKLVFPAIRKAYAGEEVVIVQHDGAPGHTHREATPARRGVVASRAMGTLCRLLEGGFTALNALSRRPFRPRGR